MTGQVKQCAMDTKEVVDLLYSIASQVGVLIGDKGAVSVFRFAGKQMGKKIGEGHAGKSVEEARALVSEFFRNKEFRGRFRKRNLKYVKLPRRAAATDICPA